MRVIAAPTAPLASSSQARLPRRTHQHASSARRPRRGTFRTRAQAEYKELLGTLQGLNDEALAAWAAEHRERLSLPFLGWLSDEELAASSHSDHQQQLWELGSKLMALREGLSPVGAEVLQAELRAAALRSCSAAGGDSDDEDEEASPAGGAAGKQRRGGQLGRQDVQQQEQASAAGPGTALATPAFSSVVQQAAALGLSPEGIALFQQQAAALEAVVGASRARSLTEVLGRAKVQNQAQVERMGAADAATRILDVLLSVQEREERAAMLPDAFTPPGSDAAVDDDAAYFSPEEDQLSTTPLRLLQAIDLYSGRLEGRVSSGGGGGAAAALAGGGLGLSLPQMQAVLRELREDVDAYWLGGAGDSC